MPKTLTLPILDDTPINIGDIVVDTRGVQRPVLVKRRIGKKRLYLLGHKNTYRFGKWKSHHSLMALGDKLIYGRKLNELGKTVR